MIAVIKIWLQGGGPGLFSVWKLKIKNPLFSLSSAKYRPPSTYFEVWSYSLNLILRD